MDEFSASFQNYYSSKLKPICCGNCGNDESSTERLKKCTVCKVIKYCNVDCQRAHWKSCHKKECKTWEKRRIWWEEIVKADLDKSANGTGDGTGMYILGLRLGIGDGAPTIHELACQLYDAAVKSSSPIEGGHPIAMLNLALHYERGLGVEQSYEKAFHYYKLVTKHPFPGEETVKPAFQALSRYYKEPERYGGVVERSAELSMKFLTFSMSNPEREDEIDGLERWWDNGGREETLECFKKKGIC